MRKTPNPSCDVFVNRANGDCILLSHCVYRKLGLTTLHGRLRQLPHEEMAAHGLEAVLADLNAFSARNDDERSDYESLPGSERRRLEKNCARVGIEALNSTELRLMLMESAGRAEGLVGSLEQSQVVTLPSSSGEFFVTLLATAGVDLTGSPGP